MDVNEIIKPENLVYRKPTLLNDNTMHYCPGCSHGVVHKLVAEIIEEMGMMENTNDFGEKELAMIMPITKWNRKDKGFLLKYVEYYRYTMRVDGFACVHADGKGAVALTQPFTFEGSNLEMNFRSSAGGYIDVSMTDENGNELEGFTDVRIFGDSLERPVVFSGDLSTLSGKAVRLKLKMADADAFSFRFYK